MPKFIAHVINPDGNRRLGTLDVVSGDYATPGNFIKYALSKRGTPGLCYGIYVINDPFSENGMTFKMHYTTLGEMAEMFKRLYTYQPVTLDGKPARITGTSCKFAHVTSAEKSVEFAWPTVARVCAMSKGQFRG